MHFLIPFTTTTTLLLSLSLLTTATTPGNPRPYALSPSARDLRSMPGQCASHGGCKVPDGLHTAYDCWNSECRPEDKGKDCTIAPGMDGKWVAKCPKNNLPYEWAWPWVAPKKDGKGH